MIIFFLALSFISCAPSGLCPCSKVKVYEPFQPCESFVVCGEGWGRMESRNRRFNISACSVNQMSQNAECKAIFQNYTDCLDVAGCDKFQCQGQLFALEKHCGGERTFTVDVY
jgi:hypothetical protein